MEMSLERLARRRAELLWIAAGWMLMVAIGSLALARRMSHSVSGPIRNIAETVPGSAAASSTGAFRSPAAEACACSPKA